MDWSTILASAGVSAVVGTVVSLVAVSSLTVRKAKAEKRYAAAQAVKALVDSELHQVVKYQHRMQFGLYREDDTHHAQDYVIAARILEAGKGLGWLRRRLLTRRCVRVFGDFNTELAQYVPPQSDSSSWQMAPILAATGRENGMKTKWSERDQGRFHRGLRGSPESREIKRLVREMRRMSASR